MELIVIITFRLNVDVLLLTLEYISLHGYRNIADIPDLIYHGISNLLVLINEFGEWNYLEKSSWSQLEESCDRNDHGSSDDACAPLTSS